MQAESGTGTGSGAHPVRNRFKVKYNGRSGRYLTVFLSLRVSGGKRVARVKLILLTEGQQISGKTVSHGIRLVSG
jgi:hypothetical protein